MFTFIYTYQFFSDSTSSVQRRCLDNGIWELDLETGLPKTYNSCFVPLAETKQDINEEFYDEVSFFLIFLF